MANLAGNPMHYAAVSVAENGTETAISGAGTAVQFVYFDTNDPAYGAIPDYTNDHITITRDGNYFIMCSVTLLSGAGAASVAELEIMKNNGDSSVGNIHVDRNMAGGGGDRGSLNLSGIVSLAKGDTIELWVENETNTANYVLEDVSISIIQVQ